MSATVTLRDLVPKDVAMELTMTGRVFEAEEALKLGLVTKLAEDPLAEALSLASQIGSGGGVSHRQKPTRFATRPCPPLRPLLATSLCRLRDVPPSPFGMMPSGSLTKFAALPAGSDSLSRFDGRCQALVARHLL